MSEYRLNSRDVSRSVFLVASILILFGSVVPTEASVYSVLIMQSQVTVSSPEVILQNGTAGTSTIYTNNTSAKVSVGALNWLSGWNKRVKITVNSSDIDKTLVDFPVLVYLSNSSSGENNEDVSFIFDELQSDNNRKKIAVTTSNGTTQCYVEIERWDDASEQAWLWVKVPNISNVSDTSLYLYCDADHADNTDYVDDANIGNSTKVWDSNYQAVHHMEEDPTGDITDSTSNDSDMTSAGEMDSIDLVDAKVGKGVNFDGSNDAYISQSSVTITQFTYSVWVNGDSFSAWRTVATIGEQRDMCLENGVLTFWANDQGYSFGSSLATGIWRQIVVTYNGTTLSGYINGSSTGNSYTPSLGSYTGTLQFARWLANYDYFDGILDEIRISNTTRSDAWIKASYESERDDLLDFGSEEVAWYDSNWNCRKKITIDHTKVEADLNDFPILVNITDTELRDYAQTDGDDILFAASDGTTKLSHEIEMFNGTTGQLITWVKANISATISTVLYVYYDNPSASNQENIPDVWSNGYVAVWHLNGDFQDSTSNNHDGTNVGSLDAAGMMARGREFNPDDGEDHLEFGAWNVTGNKITLQTWVKCDDFGQDDPRFLTKALSGSADQHVFMLGLSGSGERYLRARIRTGTTTTTLIAGTGGDLTANTWYLVAVTYDGDDSPNNIKLFRNGVEPTSYSSGSQSRTGALVQNTWPIWAGDNLNTPGYGEADGQLDEIRISNVARSPDWLETEYNNQYNSSGFHSIGIKEEKPTIKYDYVLRVNNTITDAWQIRLKKYANSNISRLQDCTIYFHNSTDGTSSQIVIENGLFINETGPWYDLGSLETIYIAMTVQASSTGTSYVRTYLEIRIPGTTTYAQYIITFEIT